MAVPLFASSLERYHDALTDRLAAVARSGRYVLGPEVEAFEQGAGRLPWRRSLRGRGQRHRRPDHRAARARRPAGRRGGAALVHLLRDRRGGGQRGRDPRLLRRRSRDLLRDRRERGECGDPAHRRDRAGAPVRQRGARGRAARPRTPGAGGRGAGDRSSARGRRAGALGHAATFSFFPSKNLPCLGDGGAIATDDDELAGRARVLRFHGSKDKDTFAEVGYNSRLDELQAAVLRVLLPELDGWNAARRAAPRPTTRAAWGPCPA